MRDPKPINPPKPSRRKSAAKLEPIDWHEFANDAVLNGNMSTLFHRPPSEDPSAYASPEALVEIEKRANRPMVVPPRVPPAEAKVIPTVGTKPPVELPGTSNPLPHDRGSDGGSRGSDVGKGRKVKPIRSVQDALTLAGQILYQAMYGAPDGTAPRQCAKGYRQLAAETHLDKDTIRDLIADFKTKGIVRQIGSYNPDTRSSKTYEVLPSHAIVQGWRESGYQFVTAGRQRPEFCTAQGQTFSGA